MRNSSTELPHPHWLCQPYERPITFSEQAKVEISMQAINGSDFHSVDSDVSAKKIMLMEQRRSRKASKKEVKLAKKLAIVEGKLICFICNKNRKVSHVSDRLLHLEIICEFSESIEFSHAL